MQTDKAEEKGPFSTLDQTKVITKSQAAVVRVVTTKSEMQTRIAMEKIEVALEVVKKVGVMDEIVAWATIVAMVSLTKGGNTLVEAAAIIAMTSVR